MRSDRFFFIVALAGLSLVGSTALAQEGRARRSPRMYLSVSDGVGINSGGGQLSSGSVWQLFRGAVVAGITRNHAIEVSAIRSQQLVPVEQRFDDRASSVKGDGVFLSYARLDQRRGGGFPTSFSLGGGVMRRPSLDAGGDDRETWAVQFGLESNVATPRFDWADLTAGARVIGMPASNKRQSVLIVLNFGFRVG